MVRKIKGYLQHTNVENHIAELLSELAEWAKKNNVTIIMNEFGVVDTAPPEDRARWIETVRTEAENNGIGWSMWSYRGTFGLYKQDAYNVERLNSSVAEALGLSY